MSAESKAVFSLSAGQLSSIGDSSPPKMVISQTTHSVLCLTASVLSLTASVLCLTADALSLTANLLCLTADPMLNQAGLIALADSHS